MEGSRPLVRLRRGRSFRRRFVAGRFEIRRRDTHPEQATLGIGPDLAQHRSTDSFADGPPHRLVAFEAEEHGVLTRPFDRDRSYRQPARPKHRHRSRPNELEQEPGVMDHPIVRRHHHVGKAELARRLPLRVHRPSGPETAAVFARGALADPSADEAVVLEALRESGRVRREDHRRATVRPQHVALGGESAVDQAATDREVLASDPGAADRDSEDPLIHHDDLRTDRCRKKREWREEQGEPAEPGAEHPRNVPASALAVAWKARCRV